MWKSRNLQERLAGGGAPLTATEWMLVRSHRAICHLTVAILKCNARLSPSKTLPRLFKLNETSPQEIKNNIKNIEVIKAIIILF